MPCTYIGKSKVIIPAISSSTPVPCITVDVTTWEGPLHAGQAGKYTTQQVVVPIGQAGIQRHKSAAHCYDPVTGESRGDISRGCSGFNDAIGKRLSWTKPPIQAAG